VNRLTLIAIATLSWIMISPASQLHAQSKRIASNSYFGCESREYFGKLVRYIVQKDTEAFKNGLASAVMTGTCTLFNSGEEVFLADTAIFSGMVKVRRRGEAAEYWTNLEAVK